jgi:hypothetical protein
MTLPQVDQSIQAHTSDPRLIARCRRKALAGAADAWQQTGDYVRAREAYRQVVRIRPDVKSCLKYLFALTGGPGQRLRASLTGLRRHV